MRVFVTGATGHIGSALVPELRQAGHQVTGFAGTGRVEAAVTEAGDRVACDFVVVGAGIQPVAPPFVGASSAAPTGAVDVEHQHEINVNVINEALRGKPADMAVTVHMCRGNYRSAWFSSGGYDFVAEGVFGGLKVDGLFLEYDDERSGTFEPLRFVPDDQVVVLGVMTTKTPELESKDTLKRRVEEAAKYVDIDRLCISPQCGFASTVEGNSLTIDQERAKLDLLVETASEIWG